MKIYFAHPINTYETPVDEKCVQIIKDNLGDQIINPSDPLIQRTFASYRKENPDTYMEFFKDLVSSCDTIVYLPFSDGMIGAGIWYEVKNVYKKGGKIYEIDLPTESLSEVDFPYVDSNKLTVEDTRIRIKGAY